MVKWHHLAALLALAEVGARLRHRGELDRWMDEGLRPSSRVALFDVAAEKRIAVLGDSIPYGEGVGEHEAYPSVLAGMLAKAYPEQQISVLNAGIRGQTVLQGWARLERHVLRNRPHLVIVAFGLNDAALGRSPVDAWREQSFWRHQRLGAHRLLGWSDLYCAVDARARRWRYHRFLATAQPSPRDPRVSARAFGACLASISRQLASRCAVVLATTTPLAPFSLAHLVPARRERQIDLYRQYDDITREVARCAGTALLDTRHSLVTCDPASAYASDGIHLTRQGQRAMAQALNPLVESLLFADEAHAR